MMWCDTVELFSKKMTSLFWFKLCLCRDQVEVNRVKAEKKYSKEAKRQQEQEKKYQMECRKKENELRKNFQVTFVLQENAPTYKAQMLFLEV